jgi:prolyl-tRNA editing enzyme YbaK/EbsC (Cys-tRNA(Pro) deacylase)
MTIPEASLRLMAAVPDVDIDIHFFPEGTKTAEDAARAIGCEVAAIVKSLVFVVIFEDDREEPVVALVPGDKRLDTDALARAAGAIRSRRASLDEVRNATGFVAGGTPPFGHQNPLRVFADPSLKRNDPVWAAGGTPSTVFPISIADLDSKVTLVWLDLAI